MRKIAVSIAMVLVLLLPATYLHAQDASTTEAPRERVRLPYEVVVTPNVTRNTLRKLKIEIEDDFFERFNELNLDDDYDVICYRAAPTGSHIKRRICEPGFFMGRRAENATEVILLMASGVPPPLLSRSDLRAVTGHQFDILERKVEEFNRSDLKLRAIGEAMAKIQSEIENYFKE